MSFYYKLIIFLLINLGALWFGSFLQGEGSRSTWYQELAIAPWTPPGWVFGIAWLIIMLSFSLFMAYAADFKTFNILLLLFLIQFVLNVSWNAIFFRYHHTGLALLVIIFLTLIVISIFLNSMRSMPYKSLLILPYVIWLLLAISLNWYAWARN